MTQSRKPRPNAPESHVVGSGEKGVAVKRLVEKRSLKTAVKVKRKVEAAVRTVSSGLCFVTAPPEIRERVPMMVSVHVAEANLSKLLQFVRQGVRVLISVGNRAPSFELVKVNTAVATCGTPRQFGALRGVVTVDERFFETLSADELDGWER